MRIEMFVKMTVAAFMGILILSGCSQDSSWFRNRAEDYQCVETYPLIQIPCNLNPEPFSEEYQVPGV